MAAAEMSKAVLQHFCASRLNDRVAHLAAAVVAKELTLVQQLQLPHVRLNIVLQGKYWAWLGFDSRV